jgi:lipopolysaccharide transport system ATP-binding protein
LAISWWDGTVFPTGAVYLYAVAIYRLDGIKVSQHVSALETIEVAAGEQRSVRLEFPCIDLADGRYVISVSLHRDLDPHSPNDTVRYDLLTHSYEFEIVGNPPLRTSLFVLPSRWIMHGVAAEAPSPER